MRRILLVLLSIFACAGSARAQGVLIPTDSQAAPLEMVQHRVSVAIEDQVAVTKVMQTFRNDTDRPLEATYIFPVPKGASVKKFTMWVGGKEVTGELVEADKARSIYSDIVRRAKDPGLLEYVGNNLLRVRVFPVPARGEQKLSLSYTSIAQNDGGVIEYVYPLKSGKSAQAMKHFAIAVKLRSATSIHNIYSPSHKIQVKQANDRRASIRFEHKGGALDRDFQLYYTTDARDVGLTTLFHRPERGEDGHFLLLLSPRAELSKVQRVPRDVVFVLDTSGSMQGVRIGQAMKALLHCLRNLRPEDRFTLVQFATTVNKYSETMVPAPGLHLVKAQRWITKMEATGSTNIDAALARSSL